ncbi:hypothetical protein CI793_09405 [Anoxybacillus ayderensis]|nr:hypothetical protein CI793_09405 [Anoxybacillus ayderensis]
MDNRIDVKTLAESLLPRMNESFQKDFKNLISEIDKNDNQDEKWFLLLHGIQQSVKNHSERFTIELVQKVVDELTKR